MGYRKRVKFTAKIYDNVCDFPVKPNFVFFGCKRPNTCRYRNEHTSDLTGN